MYLKGLAALKEHFTSVLTYPTVPLVVQPLREELDSLVRKGILSPVSQPTDWVNSMVCVTKPNGKLKLCLDPKDLNQAIKRPHYSTPTLDDVLSKLGGAN